MSDRPATGSSVLVLLAVVVAFSGCQSESPPPDGGSGTTVPPASATVGRETTLTTGESAYLLRPDGPGWETTIDFAYHNGGQDTLYIVNCNGAIVLDLQKQDGDQWAPGWYGVDNDCLSPPILIPPATTFESETRIWGAEPPTQSLNTFQDSSIAGTYRLIWHRLRRNYTGQGPHLGDTIPITERLSNPFELRIAD